MSQIKQVQYRYVTSPDIQQGVRCLLPTPLKIVANQTTTQRVCGVVDDYGSISDVPCHNFMHSFKEQEH